jgi:hypothetical protein
VAQVKFCCYTMTFKNILILLLENQKCKQGVIENVQFTKKREVSNREGTLTTHRGGDTFQQPHLSSTSQDALKSFQSHNCLLLLLCPSTGLIHLLQVLMHCSQLLVSPPMPTSQCKFLQGLPT